MKEPFPSFKEIWTKKTDPELVQKFLALFSGINVLAFISWFASGKDGPRFIGVACFGLYALAAALTLYIFILNKTSWRTYLWWVPFKAAVLFAFFHML